MTLDKFETRYIRSTFLAHPYVIRWVKGSKGCLAFLCVFGTQAVWRGRRRGGSLHRSRAGLGDLGVEEAARELRSHPPPASPSQPRSCFEPGRALARPPMNGAAERRAELRSRPTGTALIVANILQRLDSRCWPRRRLDKRRSTTCSG